MQKDQFRQEQRFWLLVSLRLTGEAAPEELAELEAYLQLHPEMEARMEILRSLWRGEPEDKGRRGGALNKHLQRLSNHLASPALKYETGIPEEEEATEPVRPSPKIRRLRWPFAGIAAAAAVLIFFFIRRQAPQSAPERTAQNTVSTKPGSKSKIQLPDGSQVWLNSDSRITYDENFRGPFREVQINGEAYLDIAKDKDHPFIIHAGAIDVKILGTSLNIRSYTNEKRTEAVLIRGSIEVTLHNSPDKKIILQPNDKLVVQDGRQMVMKETRARQRKEAMPVMTLGVAHFEEKDSTVKDILWVKNKLSFDQETLEEVARKIERWYDVKVTITDKRLKHAEYSAVFEDESLRQVLEALRAAGNGSFRYSISKREVLITP